MLVIDILEIALAFCFVLVLFFKKIDFSPLTKEKNGLIYLWLIGCALEIFGAFFDLQVEHVSKMIIILFSFLYIIFFIRLRSYCLNFVYMSTFVGFLVGVWELYHSEKAGVVHWWLYSVIYFLLFLCLFIYSKRVRAQSFKPIFLK